MPTLTRAFLKSALIYLSLALLIGVLLALRSFFATVPPVALLRRPVNLIQPLLAVLQPTYLHLFMVGWVTQLIFGIAYWMFPKSSVQSGSPAAPDWPGWTVFGLLNVGLALRLVAEPWIALAGSGGPGWLLALSAMLQLVAGWMFVALAWPRVKGR